MDPVVVVNGKEYPFVTEADLTLGEAADLEEITGQGYDFSQMGARGLAGLTYISVRRVDASVSIDDIRSLRGEDIDLKVEEGDALPPPSSADSTENAESGAPVS